MESMWFLLCQPLRDESGKIVRWYGTNTDIDDRKRAEEELQRSEVLGRRPAFDPKRKLLVASGHDEITSEQPHRIHEFDRIPRPSSGSAVESTEDLLFLSERIERRGPAPHHPQLRSGCGFSQVPAHDSTGLRPRWSAWIIGAVQDVTERHSEEALSQARPTGP